MKEILKIIEGLKILEPQQIGRAEYAKGYMDAVKNIEDAIKNNSDLSNVSNQRELLNNFSSWLNEQYKLNIPPDEDDVNRYLKNYQ